MGLTGRIMEIGVDEMSSISGLLHSLPSNVPWQTYEFISLTSNDLNTRVDRVFYPWVAVNPAKGKLWI